MTELLEIDVSIPCQAWSESLPAPEELCRKAAMSAFRAAFSEDEPPSEVSLVLADDGLVQSLNLSYRGLDKPTNVLSFAMEEGGGQRSSGAPRLLGDVILAFETVSAEAAEEGTPLADHLCHLVIHGMLHLLGHDHQTEAQAQIMEDMEVQALSRLKIDNPYGAEMTPR